MLIFTTADNGSEITIQLRVPAWLTLIDALSRQLDTVKVATNLKPLVMGAADQNVLRIRVTTAEYQAILRVAARTPMNDALLERIAIALEVIAEKPPVIVAPARPEAESVKGEPRSADGKRFRHALKSGGWLIEILVDERQVAFLHEDKDGNRNLLVLKSG